MQLSEENTADFVDSILKLSASIVAAALTRKGYRHGIDQIGPRFTKYVADELILRNVRHHVAADMLGFSVRTFRRKIAQRFLTHASLTVSSAIQSFIAKEEEISKSDIYLHFHMITPNEINVALRELNALGLIAFKARKVISLRSGDTLPNSIRRSHVRTLLIRMFKLSLADISKRLNVESEELKPILDDLVRSGEILALENDVYQALAQLDEEVIENDRHLLPALSSFFQASAKVVLDKLGSDEIHQNSRGTICGFWVKKGSGLHRDAMALFEEVNEKLDHMNERSEEEEKADLFLLNTYAYIADPDKIE